MIPRRIFQAWIGDGVPAYALRSHQAFKNAYPGYDVELVRMGSAEVRRAAAGGGSGDMSDALACAVRRSSDPEPEYAEYVGHQRRLYAGRPSSSTMVVCDLFRLELLNRFGGVYVDADSLPTPRLFDCEMMSMDRFCVCRRYSGQILPDNYFMGQAEGAGPWTNPADPFSARQLFDGLVRDASFACRKCAFTAGRLDVGAGGFYIEHFMVRSWEEFGGRIIGVPA